MYIKGLIKQKTMQLKEGSYTMLKFYITIALFAVTVECVPQCNNKKGDGMIPDPDDCSSFYWCFSDQPIKYTCQLGEVWNNDKKVCVQKGSVDDLCTKKIKTEFTCNSGHATKLPHSAKCSKYYECQGIGTAGPELKECPYPKLFDDVSKKCDYPERVRCGERVEPTDPCEYDVNTCGSEQCVPCVERFPSCKDKPDGLNAWEGREWTPLYVVCKNDRILYTEECIQIRKELPHFVFDPKQKKCVEQILITFAPKTN